MGSIHKFHARLAVSFGPLPLDRVLAITTLVQEFQRLQFQSVCSILCLLGYMASIMAVVPMLISVCGLCSSDSWVSESLRPIYYIIGFLCPRLYSKGFNGGLTLIILRKG